MRKKYLHTLNLSAAPPFQEFGACLDELDPGEEKRKEGGKRKKEKRRKEREREEEGERKEEERGEIMIEIAKHIIL